MSSPAFTQVIVDGAVLDRLFARAGDRHRACRAVLALLVARHDGTNEAVVLGAERFHARVDVASDADALFARLTPTEEAPAGLRVALGAYADSDLELHVVREGLAIVVHAERLVVRWIAAQIARLCEGLADSTRPVLGLPILGAAEESRILARTGVANVRLDEEHPTVVARFEAHAAARPAAIALVDGARTLTYAEADAAANRVAAQLTRAITPSAEGAIVAVYLERSADAVVALFGILKACATYVPIDTAYPAGRVGAILEVAQPRLVITRRALARQLPEGTAMLLVEDIVDVETMPRRTPSVDDDAYAIFTSGSTGQPKGVLVDHRTLANYLRACEDVYGFAADDRVLQGASLGFDLSLEEIFVTLTVGAALVVRSAPPIESVQLFLDECIARGISILSITSALWHELTLRLEDGAVRLPPRLRLVILGADAARPDVLEVWQRVTDGSVRLVNSYGLTETTIVATTWEATPEPLGPGWRALPVGTPLRNTSAYVLDAHDQLVPFGVPGEICIGGLAVARRYLGDDALTRARFVPDPFLHGQRMYRTGDRGVLRASGELEFLGRSDYQMKVNGVRIELGEIESRIRDIPDVTEGIVVARKSAAGETELQAYVMVAADLRAATIREYLLRVLPRPTVPAEILVVERFPLTAAGKIDRRALAELALRERRKVSWVPPKGPLEETVLAVAAEVLHVVKPSMLDGFAALGGTSLSAVRAASILGRRLERPVRARQLLQGATFQETCRAIAAGEHEPALEQDRVLDAAIQPLPHGGPAPLARVFLTGGTGFYGTFVLAELLARTGAHVVCLVRAPDEVAGLARIAKSLARFDCAVSPEVLAARVSVVIGDLAEPRLGLAPGAFAALADDVDAIFHVGAAVNLLLPYSLLRAANVCAVEDVLRLATTGTPKSVHHVSTVEVLTDTEPSDPAAWLERPAAATPARLHEGYGQSKWVAEKLVEEARARGIRAFVHRPGRLMGHATTGAFNPEDFLVRMLDACGQIGAAPDLHVDVDITPVDYAARAIVRLAELEPMADAAFHFVNRDVLDWTAFVERIVGAGYPLRTVPHADWCALLAERAQSTACAPASAEFLRYLASMTRAETENAVHGGPVGTRTEAHLDFVCPPVDGRLVATYLARLVDAGRFLLPAGWSAAAE